MRIIGGIALGLAVGAMFLLIEHLVNGIDPRDFLGIGCPVSAIGAVVGTVVGVTWELSAESKQPRTVNPLAPPPDQPRDSN